MVEPQDGWERRADDAPGGESSADEISFGRREVIVGALGTLASVSAARAQGPTADIRLIRNPRRHDEIGVGIELSSPDSDRLAVALFPRTFGGETVPAGERQSSTPGRYEKAIQKLDRFTFAECRFSRRGQYSLEFTCQTAKDEVTARFVRRGDNGKPPLAAAVGLAAFFRGDARLVFRLDRAQAELLRWDLFGERLEVRKGGADLSLWLAPRPTQRLGITEWQESDWRLSLKPHEGTEIWALDGMALVDQLDLRRAQGDQGEGAHIQQAQEFDLLEKQGKTPKKEDPKSAAPSKPAEDASYNASAWLGEAKLAWMKPIDSQQPRLNRYEIGKRDLPRTRPSVEIVRPNSLATLTLRQWGEPRNTLAMIRGPLDISMRFAGTATPQAPDVTFPLTDALLTRQDRATRAANSPEKPGDNSDEAIEETISGHVNDKPFAVDTALCTLIVEGDPVLPRDQPATDADGKPKPNAFGNRRLDNRTEFALKPAKGLTQFHLAARRDRIASFDARVRLRQATTALPNASKGGDKLVEPGEVWSRLDFDGTEIAFRLALPDQAWPSARGVVILGEPPEPLYGLTLPKKKAEPGEVKPAHISIALDGARLRVRRDSDNLALTFGFARMALELGKEGGRIVPNLRLSGSGTGETASTETGERQFDDRPLLIVDFPPQHVAEKAYYRQIDTSLPEVPSSLQQDTAKALSTGLEKWRTETVDTEKLKIRRDLFKSEQELLEKIIGDKADPRNVQVTASGLSDLLKLRTDDGSSTQWEGKIGKSGDDLKTLKDRWGALPLDQRAYWLGGTGKAIDPDAREVWLEIWRGFRTTAAAERSPDWTQFGELVAALPDVVLPLEIDTDLRRRALDAKGNPDPERLTRDRLQEKRKRSAEFEWTYKAYPLLKGRPAGWPNEYPGGDEIGAIGGKAKAEPEKAEILNFVVALAAESAKFGADEFLPVTPARLSGPSRLVFRFDPAGGSLDDRNINLRSSRGEELEGTRAIDYSLEGLTDWGRFDLAVTRRAETLELLAGNRLPFNALRGVDLDPGRVLAYQGIRPGRSIEGRMADIRASLRPPAQYETAIELPFRIYLSPDQFGRFRTRRPISPAVIRPESPGVPVRHQKMWPVLWSANLQIGSAPPTVRAIWSDDFLPEAITNGAEAPRRGSHAPWRHPAVDDEQFRTALDAYDRHEIVALSSVYGMPVMGRRNDLDNLVDSSQFEPPANYKLRGLKADDLASGAGKADLSGIYNPARLDIAELRLTAMGGSLRHDTAFVPPAAAVRADNTNLFDAFSVERWRQITVLGRDIEVEVVYKGFLFPLGVRASLVKLTERRFVRHGSSPTDPITAFLIQRKFIRIGRPDKEFPAVGQPDRSRRFPVSKLTMLTRVTPDIVDPYVGDPRPRWKMSGTEVGITPNGKIGFLGTKPKGICFWPRTRSGEGGNIGFEFKIDGDAAPLRMPMIFVDNTAANDPDTMALLAQYYGWDSGNDDLSQTNTRLRTLQMGGVRRRYADENQDGECHFETFTWEVKAEGRMALDATKEATTFVNNYYRFDPLLQGSDQPPFYPFISKANIRIGQAERFVGRVLNPVDVQFFDKYRIGGFPGAEEAANKDKPTERQAYYLRHAERYLELLRTLPLNMGEAGDRSGGIGQPAMDLKYLSRRYGLMADKEPDVSQAAKTEAPANQADAAPADPPAPQFNLEKFFNGDAKLLGIISFSDLLKGISSAMPELKEKVDSATEDTAAALRQVVLPELERALKSLQEMWAKANDAVRGASTAPGIPPLEIGQVYPDIKPALDALLDKVRRAQLASNVDLVAAMNEVQASGRKLVTAISRTLADPITPLREDLRGKFRNIREELQKFTDSLSGAVAAAIDELGTALIAELKNAVDSVLRPRIAELRPFARLFFALPMPPGLGTTLLELPKGDAARVEIARELDGALAEGLVAALDGLRSISQPAQQAALQRGLAAAQNALDEGRVTDLQAKAVVSAYKAEAQKLLGDLPTDSNGALRRLLQQVPGPLHPWLLGDEGVVPRLVRTARLLKDHVTRGDVKVLEVVTTEIGESLRATLSVVVQGELSKSCNGLAEKLAGLANALFLPREVSAGQPQSIATLNASLDGLASAFSDTADSALRLALDRFGTFHDLLKLDSLKEFCELKESKSPFPGLVLSVIRDLSALKVEIGDLVADRLKTLAAMAQGAATQARADAVNVFADRISDFVVGIGTAVADALAALDKAIPQAPDGSTALGREVAVQIAAVRATISTIRRDIDTANSLMAKAGETKATDKNVVDALSMLIVALQGTVRSTETSLEDARKTLEVAFESQKQAVETGAVHIVGQVDRQISTLLGQVLLSGEAAKKAAVIAIGRAVSPVFRGMFVTIYHPADIVRQKGREIFNTDQGILKKIFAFLRGPNGEPLGELFEIRAPDGKGTDQLAAEIEIVGNLAEVKSEETYVKDLASLADSWIKGTAAPLLLMRKLDYVLAAVLRGDFAQFVDLNQIRRQVDETIRKMVPSRISRSYDLKLRMRDIDDLVVFSSKSKAGSEFGLPMTHPRGLPETLVLQARGVVDVLQPKNSSFDAVGYLPGFALGLLPGFDVATLLIPPTSFAGGLNKPFDLSLKVADVKLGEQVQFLEKLQSILGAPADGSGFFVRPMIGRGIGIVAGYKLPISPITIGNMFIDNLSLGIAAELPFDNGDARFVISVSRPEAPFMIAVAPYAGAGHFGLIANPKRIVGFEASFQFGGGGGFAFGPLKGTGRISVGIFVRKIDDYTELYGTFYAGGSARIACFGIGAQLNVRLKQQGGNCEGEATFTFTFSVGIKDIEYSVTVWKRQEGSGSSKSANGGSKAPNGRRRRQAARPVGPPLAVLENATWCKGEDYGRYRSYFSHRPVLATGRTVTAAAAAKGSAPTEPSTRKVWVMP